MKQAFEDIVAENTPWIYRYLYGKVGDRASAEDLTQEVWLRAFRAYDNYIEDGRLRRWLMRIAQNTYRTAVAQPSVPIVCSLDADGDDDPLYTYLADRDAIDPADAAVEAELTQDVLRALADLPEKQRRVLTCRFLWDMSPRETAVALDLPEGSVKSATYYGLEKLRRTLIVPEITQQKGENTMDCKTAYKYLFVYAMDKLHGETKDALDKHIAECPACRKIVDALRRLIPHLPEDKDGTTHFAIDFPEMGVSFAGVGIGIPNVEELNALLRERGGKIPDNECWLQVGYDGKIPLIGYFLNEGEEPAIRIVDGDGFPGHKMVKTTALERLYPYTWLYTSYTGDREVGKTSNRLGSPGLCSLYQAIPAHTTRKMLRGNGFIQCGETTFAYAQRYTAQDEVIDLEYTFA